ncbi:hypothetical protein [Streptomyces sp. ODS28]|uniref:hypothetical protein n=1 Tax=Streptomyces sp. ODS28 TaxID=3136688 RepID=UPI0031EE9E76
MAVLAWLLIPVGAAIAVGTWGWWAARRGTCGPDRKGAAGFARFCEAMEHAEHAGLEQKYSTSPAPGRAHATPA